MLLAESNLTVEKCAEIEALLLDPTYSALHLVLLLILTISLGAIALLIHQFITHRIMVHGNLLLLFFAIVLCNFLSDFTFFLFQLRYKLLLLFYHHPCHLLTPFWMAAFFYSGMSINALAYPLVHFCVMLERLRATFIAEKYEQEGQRMGIWMLAIIWPLALANFLFTIWAADDREPQGIVHLTSASTASYLFGVIVLNFFLINLTVLGDWRVTLWNRRMQAKRSYSLDGYSLSKNYQVNENELAMGLILPLDVSYALLYSLYIGLSIVLRANVNKLTPLQYWTLYCACNTLLFSYSTLTIVVYIRFVRHLGNRCKRRGKLDGCPAAGEQLARIHFNQLMAQWQ